MLIHCKKYVAGLAGQPDDLDVFGQEINAGTRAVCLLNMVFNGIKKFDIRLGDTLNNPLHIQNGQLVKFDRVVASPPFSLSGWDSDSASNDPFQRFGFGVPPRHCADFAFIQHMIASLKDGGIMCSVVPNGVLFRGGSEGEIRKRLLEEDLVSSYLILWFIYRNDGTGNCVDHQ